MRSTELIQKEESADQNAERDPEVRIGGDGAKQIAASGAVGGHERIAYRTAVLGASTSLRHLFAGSSGGLSAIRRHKTKATDLFDRWPKKRPGCGLERHLQAELDLAGVAKGIDARAIAGPECFFIRRSSVVDRA